MESQKTYLTLSNGRRLEIPDAAEEAAINAGIAADPDTYELSEAEFKMLRPHPFIGRPPAKNPRLITTIRFEQDVLAALKATGKGWQTRVNDMVRREVLGKREARVA